jgi:hypothetical protein
VFSRALAAVALASMPACRHTETPGPIGPAREIETPAAAGSGEPSLAATRDGRVYLSWIEPAGEGRHALRLAVRRPGGSWSAPRTVAEGEGFVVNWADFPGVAALEDGALFAYWRVRHSHGGRYAYDVRLAVSKDGGASWSAPIVPHRDGTASEHGFVSLAASGSDRMTAVWLDGRNTVVADPAKAEMALMTTTLGADGQLGEETIVDGRVCDCCQTSAARTDRGVVVAYRDRTEKEVRDVSVVRSTAGGWSEPLVLGRDAWEINGCPVNGPAVAAAGARVSVAWFAAPRDQPHVSVAFSGDGGATFGAAVRVDDGRPLGRVDVVALPRGALVSWLEQVGTGAELRVRAVTPDGTRGAGLTVAGSSAARSSGFPRMEASGGEVVLAWTDPSEPPRVRTAVLPLTR